MNPSASSCEVPGRRSESSISQLPFSIDRPFFDLLRSPDLVPGTTIGPYTVVRTLGEGGTGTVYLASRSDGEFERQVAVKVLKRGLEIDEIVRRFRQERQILAQLRHSNIAELYDGGTTRDHRPFLVMEYVEGRPIDQFCSSRGLSLRQRLHLFLEVCGAVELAHRQLVIHRDLKPSNILVSCDGVVKLLDFGIAKILDPVLGATMTVDGLRPMTPEYASPEQIEGGPVTTATDVYSLGVLLYLLMTGRHPYSIPSSSASALRRAVCEQEPVKPSIAVEDIHRRRDEALHHRFGGDDPKRLRRRLAGDLDNIVLMALRKEPEHRYPSVDQLARDLHRYLSHRPVAARAATWRYRAGRLMRRRAKELALTSALALLAAAFALDHWLQHRRALFERDKAQQISAFLTEIFEISDPTEALASRVSAREVLDRGARRLERGELAEHPELRAALKHTVATVYRNLGAYRTAETLIEQALAERRRLLGVRHEDVAASLRELAHLRWLIGDYRSAEELFGQVIELRGEGDGAVLAAKNGLARTYLSQGRYGQAESLLLATLEAFGHRPASDSESRAESLSLLGEVLRELGRYEDSELSFRDALSRRAERLGAEHPEVARTLSDLASLLALAGRFDEAEALQRKALATCRKVFGERHPRVAAARHALAAVLRARGEYDDAVTLLRDTLSTFRKEYGDEHPRVPMMLNELGLALHYRGDLEPAATALRESLELGDRAFGERHPEIAAIRNDLALLYKSTGDLAAAVDLSRQSLELIRDLVGDEHPHVATAMLTHAEILHAKGDLLAAEPLARRSLALRRRLLGDAHPHVAYGLNRLGRMLRDRGELKEAESILRQALEAGRRAWQDEANPYQLAAWNDEANPYQLAAWNDLATVVDRSGDAAAAESLYRRVLTLYRDTLGEEHPNVATVMNNLGGALFDQGKLSAAEPLVRDALEMRRRLRGDEHPQVAISLTLLARIRLAQGDAAAAEPLLRRALELYAGSFGPRHRRTAEATSLLGSSLLTLGRRREAEPLLRAGWRVLSELLGPESALARQARTRLDRIE